MLLSNGRENAVTLLIVLFVLQSVVSEVYYGKWKPYDFSRT